MIRIRLTQDLTALPVFGPNFNSGTEGILVDVVGNYSLIDIPWKRLRERVRPEASIEPKEIKDSVYIEGEARVGVPIVYCNGPHLAYHGLTKRVHNDGSVDIELTGVFRGRVRGCDSYAVIVN
jgi:hypothetical protein